MYLLYGRKHAVTRYKKLIAIGAALVAAQLLFAACPGDRSPSQSATSLDLISFHGAARQLRETGWINLSSPLSSYYLARGWSHPYALSEEGPTVVVAVSQESVLRYRVLRPAGRWLSFIIRSVGRHGGPARQQIEVLAAGRRLALLEVGGREARVQMVHIPAAVQRVGDNELTFRFAFYVPNEGFVTSRQSYDEFPFPGVAAYFSELNIYFGDEEGYLRHEIRDEARAIQLVAGGRHLSQLPNSALCYAFDIKRGTRLALSGTVHGQRTERGELTVSVSSRTDAQPQWRELWSRGFSFASGETTHQFATDLPLDELADLTAELRFDVSSSERFSNAAVLWRRLRLEVPAQEEHSTAPPREPVRLSGGARHVVFIVLDAARPDHFGCYGDERGMTPRIDELAESSIVFRDAIAPAPYTIASIASLFSGLLPDSHGVRTTHSIFPEELENMPRAFKRSGYYTLALAGTQFITRRYGLTRDCDEVLYLRTDQDRADRVTTMSVETMEAGVAAAAASGKPVFIYAHFLPPHWPYRPPEPFRHHYIRDPQITYWRSWMIKALLDFGIIDAENPDVATHHRRYMNNLLYADHVTGQLLELLRRHGLYDDALIIVTADHGEAFGEHLSFGHNTTVYDGMIKIPLIVRVPGIERHGEAAQQVGLIDFFPTLAELFELDVEPVPFQGRSIAPLISGLKQEPSDFYYSRATGVDLIFTMRGQRFKYVHHDHREELFDLIADPGETVNVIERFPVLAAALRQRAMLMIASSAALRSDQGLEVELSPEDRRTLRDLGYF